MIPQKVPKDVSPLNFTNS